MIVNFDYLMGGGEGAPTVVGLMTTISGLDLLPDVGNSFWSTTSSRGGEMALAPPVTSVCSLVTKIESSQQTKKLLFLAFGWFVVISAKRYQFLTIKVGSGF